ncbi:uncharacterized protein [Amphiura filiformis]|uniref:uncharacterized protein n=1 Tax=Amphiura filiformis TaxID=82378 RepID=UPI003B21F637
MDYTSLILLLISPILVILDISSFSVAERITSVHARSPTLPVEEGGILSLHCEVSNLKTDQHEVTILRLTDSGATRLTMGNSVNSDLVDDRVFLAVRQLQAGSTVYFLTIIKATKEDEGEYVCKVIQEGISTIDIAVSSAKLNIMYFPPDSDPECYPKEPPTVSYGEAITLRCSSESANPKVLLKWINGDNVVSKNQTTIGDRQVSYMRIIPRNGDLFLCRVTSPAFPNRERDCHVGPINVIRDPSATSSTDDNNIPHIPELVPIVSPPANEDNEPPVDIPKVVLDCEEDCRLLNTRSFYWIISTCVTGLFAVIFCIACIILLCKYHYQSQRTYERGRCVSTRPHVQDIYSELDIKRCDNKEYMVLSNNRRLLPGPPRHPDVAQTESSKTGLQ